MLKQNIYVLKHFVFEIKWMGKFMKIATWEWEKEIKTNFPNFSLQECNI